MNTLKATATGAGPTNTTTETSIQGGGSYSLPVDYAIVGSQIRVSCHGELSTAAAPGTLRFRVKLGSNVICDSGALTPTALLFFTDFMLECVIGFSAIGATGTAGGVGVVTIDTGSGTALIWTLQDQGAVVDTTASLAIDVTAQWSTASASNIFTCKKFMIEATGPVN